MNWTNAHRNRLYQVIEDKWGAAINIEQFEEWLASFGIKWAELYHENDAPQGTVAVHEGPGIEDKDFKMCWVIPNEVAVKFLFLGVP